MTEDAIVAAAKDVAVDGDPCRSSCGKRRKIGDAEKRRSPPPPASSSSAPPPSARNESPSTLNSNGVGWRAELHESVGWLGAAGIARLLCEHVPRPTLDAIVARNRADDLAPVADTRLPGDRRPRPHGLLLAPVGRRRASRRVVARLSASRGAVGRRAHGAAGAPRGNATARRRSTHPGRRRRRRVGQLGAGSDRHSNVGHRLTVRIHTRTAFDRRLAAQLSRVTTLTALHLPDCRSWSNAQTFVGASAAGLLRLSISVLGADMERDGLDFSQLARCVSLTAVELRCLHLSARNAGALEAALVAMPRLRSLALVNPCATTNEHPVQQLTLAFTTRLPQLDALRLAYPSNAVHTHGYRLVFADRPCRNVTRLDVSDSSVRLADVRLAFPALTALAVSVTASFPDGSRLLPPLLVELDLRRRSSVCSVTAAMLAGATRWSDCGQCACASNRLVRLGADASSDTEPTALRRVLLAKACVVRQCGANAYSSLLLPRYFDDAYASGTTLIRVELVH